MKKLFIILITLLITTLLVGCGITEKAQEKAAEKALENSLGSDVNIDIDGEKYTYKDEEGNKIEIGGTEWPSDKEAVFIPKFDKQPVTACVVMGNVYIIDIEKVNQKDYEDYLQTIKDAGFTKNVFSIEEAGEEGYYQYQAVDDNGNSMTLSYEIGAKLLQIMGSAAVEQ